MTAREICREIADQFDIIYSSARKFGFARGDAILVRDEALFHSMEDLIPMYEGFLTYGGMSVREMEAMTVGGWPEKLAEAFKAEFGEDQ